MGPVSVRRRVVVAASLESWLPFLIYGGLALAIPASMIVMSFLFAQRPARRVKARVIPFESGVSTGPPRQQRFTISFYLTAMLFIVFDIEIVFLYPLAVVLDQLGWFGLVEFMFFIGVLVFAYVYVWRKGALEWQ
jgi:NADH-quinone oxidoreductase subunit A